MAQLESKMREQVRLSLLRFLDSASPRALADSLLAAFLRGEGFNVNLENTRTELAYLEGKGLVGKEAKTISPENPAWKITSAGQDHYAITANG